MPCGTLGTYFFDGTSFSGATAVYTTSALTTPAPDGYYSQGGLYRQQFGGLLGPVVPCPACTIDCGDPILGQGNHGKYILNLQLGSTPGAAIITFNVGAPGVELAVPDGCTWFYEDAAGTPIAASEYSSLVGGYQEGLIGCQSGYPASWYYCNGGNTIQTNIGFPYANSGTEYTYTSGAWAVTGVATIGPYDGIVAPATPGQSTLLDWNCTNNCVADVANCCGAGNCVGCGIAIPECTPGTPIAPNLPTGTNWPQCGNESRNAVMVVPSPPGVTNTVLTIEVEAPCAGTWWAIDVQCPEELTAIPSSTIVTSGPVCDAVITTEYYHVPVDAWGNTNPNSGYDAAQDFNPGNGVVAAGQAKGTLGWHDWIFVDKYGVTPLPAGNYKMESPAGSGTYWDVKVGINSYDSCDPSCNPPFAQFPHATYPPTGPVQDGIVDSMCECLPPAPCATPIPGAGGTGEYFLNIDLGATQGAAIVKFDPMAVPDRCEWTYDGTTASYYSQNNVLNPSTGDGYLEGLIGTIGSGGGCTPAQTNAGTTPSTSSAGTIWNWNGTTFINTLTPTTIGPYGAIMTGVNATSLTAAAPAGTGAFGPPMRQWPCMVIPKPNASPQIANIIIDGPCGGTAWNVQVICPGPLPSVPVNIVSTSCAGPFDGEMFFADVNSATPHSSTLIGSNDWVFEDENAETPYPAGTYTIDNGGGVIACVVIANYAGGSIVHQYSLCAGSC